jgi:hypothetical protein
MRKNFLLCFTLLAMNGCGVVQQAQLNTGMKQAEQAALSCGAQAIPAEIAQAWTQVSEEIGTCPSGTDSNPSPPSKAVEANQCWTKRVNQYVAPVENNKAALNKLLESGRENAEKYKDGKIDRSAVNRGMEIAWQDYTRGKTSYFKLAQCKNAALQQYVMPSYSNKGLLMDLMARQSEVGLAIDKGEMSLEQGDIEVQKSWAALASAEQQVNAVMQAQNAQRGTAMQALGAELLRGPPPSTVRHTNCTVGSGGNSMDCTTR